MKGDRLMESTRSVHDPYAAAEAAHGAANPEPHLWTDRFTPERYVTAFSHFEECQTRDGKKVETIVGRLRDGTWSREWLFPPDDPKSRGWRAQELEFIDEVRSALKSGDILVMELGAERPSIDNPDRKVRPFSATHHPAEDEHSDNGAATAEALEAERDERDAELSGVAKAARAANAPLSRRDDAD
jgi:hypothetical protein